MELGGFSLSLTVKDIKKSKEFYEALGFTKFHGEEENGWLIMKSSSCNIGLFQGMFEKNILTFNPGWDENANNIDSYTDVRDILKTVKTNEIEVIQETIKSETGPGSFIIEDSDGNQIMFDQHV